jgi:RNA polymerase-binding transcription factor DksA
MSGYGSPDDDAEHAAVLAENGVHHARSLLSGPVRDWCADCGEPIPAARVEFLRSQRMKCMYCVQCQPRHDNAPRVRMV